MAHCLTTYSLNQNIYSGSALFPALANEESSVHCFCSCPSWFLRKFAVMNQFHFQLLLYWIFSAFKNTSPPSLMQLPLLVTTPALPSALPSPLPATSPEESTTLAISTHTHLHATQIWLRKPPVPRNYYHRDQKIPPSCCTQGTLKVKIPLASRISEKLHMFQRTNLLKSMNIWPC